MYHDQGHAVFKSLYFDEGVNVTVGLPIIRTSVDHGTAFDIAGQGVANEAEPGPGHRAGRPAWAQVGRDLAGGPGVDLGRPFHGPDGA